MFNFKEIENEINNLQIKNHNINNIIQQPKNSKLDFENLFHKKENNNDKKSVFSNKSMFSFLPSNKLKKYLENNINNNIENNEIKTLDKNFNNKSVNLEIINTNSNFEKKIEPKNYLKIYDNFVKENTIVKLLLNRDLEGLKNAIKGKKNYIINIFNKNRIRKKRFN